MTDRDTAAESEWMTAREAAERLGVSKARMAKLLADGALTSQPGLRDRRVKLIRRADVERLASEPSGRKPTKRKSSRQHSRQGR